MRIGPGRLFLVAALLGGLFLACESLGRRPPFLPSPPGSVRGFTALYRVAYSDECLHRKARLAVAFIAPDRLRLEVFDPLGSSRAALVLNSGKALFLTPGDRTYRFFESGREALQAIAALPMEPLLLPSLLLGDGSGPAPLSCEPAPHQEDPEDRDCLGTDGRTVIQWRQGGRRAVVKSGSGEIVLVHYGRRGRLSRSLPVAVHLQTSDGAVRIDLTASEMRLAVPGEEVFSTTPPAGFREMPIGRNEPPAVVGARP